MPLYPPALIYLLLPLTWSLSFFCLLHLWFAGFGMFQLARRWTCNNFAAAFAGVAFSFNGLTLNLLMWPSHIATLSWMPWVVLAVESAWREGGRKVFLAAIVGAMQMLAGGPETIFFTWIFLLILWIQQFVKGESPRIGMFYRFPTIVAVVILLAAAQLLSFLDLTAHSQRETGFADTRWSMPAWGWVNFLVPMAFGSTRDMGIFFQYGQNWTSSYYLGIGTLWLALLAVLTLRERRVWLLGACAAVALLFAFGEHTPVYPALRRIIPQLSLMTYPVKYLMFVAFFAPLLAAFALARQQNLQNGERRKFSGHVILLGSILLALLAGILFWTWRFPFFDRRRSRNLVQRPLPRLVPAADRRAAGVLDAAVKIWSAPDHAAHSGFGCVARYAHARAGTKPDRAAEHLHLWPGARKTGHESTAGTGRLARDAHADGRVAVCSFRHRQPAK